VVIFMEIKKTEISNDKGSIRISEEVVSTVAGLAAIEVEGVSAMSGSWGTDLAEKLGKKNFAKGIKVDLTEDQAKIDIFIVVQYGFEIPKVAVSVQQAVKSAVEMMTGLIVSVVNVQVVSISMPQKKETAQEIEGTAEKKE